MAAWATMRQCCWDEAADVARGSARRGVVVDRAVQGRWRGVEDS